MLQNVIDNRKRQHRWKRINAVVEPTWHDNTASDADKAEPAAHELDYDERNGISLAEAIAWAQTLPFPATLHLYDADDNPKT
jgi:hypothetical protein